MKNITIITHAKAIIMLKKDHVREVKESITRETSESLTLIHVDVTEIWLNNINNNQSILINKQINLSSSS